MTDSQFELVRVVTMGGTKNREDAGVKSREEMTMVGEKVMCGVVYSAQTLIDDPPSNTIARLWWVLQLMVGSDAMLMVLILVCLLHQLDASSMQMGSILQHGQVLSPSWEGSCLAGWWHATKPCRFEVMFHDVKDQIACVWFPLHQEINDGMVLL